VRIFLTGATGLIGRRFVADRVARGDALTIVSRDAQRARDTVLGGDGPAPDVVEADLRQPGDWQKRVDGCDAVVHLAGAGVADRRWTRGYRRLIVDSRLESTRHVVEAIERAQTRPRILVNASATGYYGERGDTVLDETAPVGNDFLAELCVQWETAAARAADGATRVVLLRTSVVLDPRGGALARMLPIFRLGLGGPLGSGRQYFPWIHWRDVVGLINLALADDTLSGPLNVVAPETVTNRQFTATLGGVLHRPAVLPVPVSALRVVMGEMGRYVVASQRVVPLLATGHGYTFAFERLRPALEDLLG
jgi:uncharacterized protein (TIGR01777 family)